jgi:malate permease and related proteins
MSNFFLLVLCLSAGFFFKKLKGFPPNAHLGLNAFIIYVSMPAISFYYVPKIPWDSRIIYPFLTGLIVLWLAVAFFHALKFIFRFNQATLGCLVITCGMSNISFVGFPVIEAFYGQEGLKVAVLVDQGCFLTLSTWCMALAMIYSTGSVQKSVIIQRLFTFPPFIAFLAALLMTVMWGEAPESMQVIFKKLGDTLTPLALFSVGLQIEFSGASVKIKNFLLGLGYKLLVAPLFIWFLYVIVLKQEGLVGKVCVMEMAMPPMISAAIIATEYNLNPPLANLLAGVGIPLSLLTLWGWNWFLG